MTGSEKVDEVRVASSTLCGQSWPDDLMNRVRLFGSYFPRGLTSWRQSSAWYDLRYLLPVGMQATRKPTC